MTGSRSLTISAIDIGPLPVSAARYVPTSTSCSRRLRLVAFIRTYKGEHGGISPSLGEMAAALNTSRSRVSEHLQRLEHDGMISRVRGARRAILLLDDPEHIEAEAVSLLRRLGWQVNDDLRQIAAPVTNSELTVPPELDNIPGLAEGGHDPSENSAGRDRPIE